MKQSDIIQETRCWLESVIIALNFCPFARREFVNQRIRYSVAETVDLASALQQLADEIAYLEAHSETETTLLILPEGFVKFDDFLDLIDLSDQLIDELGYRSVYQLAHFHPQYCFDGIQADDASNFTNRSPWPTLHLLRESSLQKAIESHGNTSAIPENNIKLARELGFAKMQALLNQCKQTDT